MTEPITQEVYLVNGELQRWEGPWQEVVSPVHVADETGATPKVLGRYPLMDTAKARKSWRCGPGL